MPLPGRLPPMGWEPVADTDPVSLGASLGSLQRLLGTARPDTLTTLRSQWTSLIGARLSAHCELHSLRSSAMVVSTTEPAVAEQLRWAATDLVAAANELVPSAGITSLHVILSFAGTPDADFHDA